MPDSQLAGLGTTAHRRSDFGALSPFLLPTFLNPPALPTQSLKRLLNSVAAEHGFLFKRPNTFLFFDYPDAMGTAISGINNQDIVLRSLHGFLRAFVTDLLHVFAACRINAQSELRGQCDFSVRVASLSAIGFC